MITVVEYDKENRNIEKHPVGLRYRALFGNKLDWRTEGFERWLKSHIKNKTSPLDRPKLFIKNKANSVKAKTTKKAPAQKKSAKKKPAQPTATDQVLNIIKRSKKGVYLGAW